MLRNRIRIEAPIVNLLAAAIVAGCGGGDSGSPPPSMPVPPQSPSLATTSVTLQWDPVTVSDLAGYKIYQSTTQQSLGTLVKGDIAASITTYTVSNLQRGTHYYFVVRAYDTSGNESSSSNQVTWAGP